MVITEALKIRKRVPSGERIQDRPYEAGVKNLKKYFERMYSEWDFMLNLRL